MTGTFTEPNWRVCGCTGDDCTGCYIRAGGTCCWVGESLCQGCGGKMNLDGHRLTPSGLQVPARG